jgi:hypothetical protein
MTPLIYSENTYSDIKYLSLQRLIRLFLTAMQIREVSPYLPVIYSEFTLLRHKLLILVNIIKKVNLVSLSLPIVVFLFIKVLFSNRLESNSHFSKYNPRTC